MYPFMYMHAQGCIKDMKHIEELRFFISSGDFSRSRPQAYAHGMNTDSPIAEYPQ